MPTQWNERIFCAFLPGASIDEFRATAGRTSEMATMLISYPVTLLVDRMTKADQRSTLRKEKDEAQRLISLGDGMVWFQDSDFDSGDRLVPFWT